MIKVTLNGDGFIIEGHADYAEYGHDIVCASVSVVSQYISNLLEKNIPSVRVTKRSGYLEVKANLIYPTTRIVLRTFNEFITDIEKQYPEYIQIIRK